jgi:secreted trypsin-like serine protease
MANLSILIAVFALLQAASCGKLSDSLDKTPFIVGGEITDISNFPHSLALLDLNHGGFICGASNIGRLWAMSAAHCLDLNTPASMINLRGGSSSRIRGGQLFFVSRYILHPQYNRNTLDSDIALINVDVRNFFVVECKV